MHCIASHYICLSNLYKLGGIRINHRYFKCETEGSRPDEYLTLLEELKNSFVKAGEMDH